MQTEIKKRKENGEIFMNNTHSSRARSTVLPLVLTALFAALTAIGAFLRRPQAAPKMNKMEKKGGE